MFQRHPPHGRGVCFGYPDVVLGTGPGKKVVPSEPLWRSLDVQVDVVDVKPLRGMELVLDLNQSTSTFDAQYDFAINPGTYEHVFDVVQAMVTGYRMVKPGGLSFHTGPIGRGKHGYWNFTQDTFSAFYQANGGEVLFEARVEGSLFVTARNGPEGSGPIRLPQEDRKR